MRKPIAGHKYSVKLLADNLYFFVSKANVSVISLIYWIIFRNCFFEMNKVH